MNRCPLRYRDVDVIRTALDLMPDGVRRSVEHADILLADPIFVGLHNYEGDSYSYRDCAHVVYDYHQRCRPRSRRTTTVVLPTPKSLKTVVHEYGHVLDEQLGFDLQFAPVSAYATTNRQEAFAEAFAAWVMGEQWIIADEPAAAHLCPLARNIFERLG